MDNDSTFEVTYEIDDGYCAGARPQRFTMWKSDIEGLSIEEAQAVIEDAAYEDMMTVVGVHSIEYDINLEEVCNGEEEE